MDALPYILQIALFGAAGTSFVIAHLKNLAASDRSGVSPAERWRVFRLPHKRGPETAEQLRMRRQAALQSVWGFVFLGSAAVTPLLFRALHLGA
jgi:hypothetical protein